MVLVGPVVRCDVKLKAETYLAQYQPEDWPSRYASTTFSTMSSLYACKYRCRSLLCAR